MRYSFFMKFMMVLATTPVWSQHSALALHHPTKSCLDGRIRYTPYNAHDVVQLNTVIGIATHVVLEEGEQYMTHAFGDANAYAFAVEKNHLFLKPKAENASRPFNLQPSINWFLPILRNLKKPL